jgi:Uncharacterized protein conserved in bacteria (DUF2330)
MPRILCIIASITSIATLLAYSQSDVEGCAPVRRANGPSISIAEESAIIVWDPVKKMQHFIRRAAFDTKSPDFGFLVPTPTIPELPLKEVGDNIFRAMDKWILPRTVEETSWEFNPMLCMFGGMAAPDKAARMEAKNSVRLLHEQKVGGFDINILEADVAEALAKWIKDHGFSADPELYEWLTPYVAGKWKISAFKITQDPKTGQLAATKAVRMSFKTDRPFFPYREPEARKPKKDEADNEDKDRPNHGGRLLRVFFVADTRMDGKLGNQAWHAKTSWANELTEEQRKQLSKETGVPEEQIPAKAWLTTFEDRASPRPGNEEVYFDPAQDRTPIVPPPFIKHSDVWIPIDCVLVSVFLITLVAAPIMYKIIRKKPA